jgi:glycyl-tRNA synthetase
VVEPSFGIGRTVQTLLAHAYETDEVDGETRTYLGLVPEIAPRDVAVFPLVTNDDRLTALATQVADDLRATGLSVAYDESGSIGRRYRRQDEVGTPFCVTVDRDGVEGAGPETVTVRERDSAAQIRVPVDDLVETLRSLHAGEPFEAVASRHESVETDVETT